MRFYPINTKNIIMLQKFYLLICLSWLAYHSNAQNSQWEGDWYGNIDAGLGKLPLVFHLQNENGIWTGSADSPKEKQFGLKFKSVEINQNRITIEFKDQPATYIGDLDEETQTIAGQWKQGQFFDLTLSRQPEKEEKPNRPQEPTVFDYEQQEAEVYNPKAKVKLFGTLSYPKNGKNLTTVLLISGSGAQDRDANTFEHKPFLLIADLLTRNGFAVLRMDDRGAGKSETNNKPMTTADVLQDVEFCVQWLRSQPQVNPAKIGLIGHSEGGIVAPMLAAKDKKIAFVVMLASLGVDGRTLSIQQSEEITYSAGFSPTLRAALKDVQTAILDLAIRKKNKDINLQELKKAIDPLVTGLTAEEKQMIGYSDEFLQASLPAINGAAFRYFLSIKPQEYLPKVKCPVLALNGSRDIQVKAAPNLAAIQTLLEKGKNPNFSCQLLPNLNHLFQTCQNCTLEEYAKLEETFSPAALEIILQWVKKWQK